MHVLYKNNEIVKTSACDTASIEVYEGIKTLRIICEINNFIYFDMVI